MSIGSPSQSEPSETDESLEGLSRIEITQKVDSYSKMESAMQESEKRIFSYLNERLKQESTEFYRIDNLEEDSDYEKALLQYFYENKDKVFLCRLSEKKYKLIGIQPKNRKPLTFVDENGNEFDSGLGSIRMRYYVAFDKNDPMLKEIEELMEKKGEMVKLIQVIQPELADMIPLNAMIPSQYHFGFLKAFACFPPTIESNLSQLDSLNLIAPTPEELVGNYTGNDYEKKMNICYNLQSSETVQAALMHEFGHFAEDVSSENHAYLINEIKGNFEWLKMSLSSDEFYVGPFGEFRNERVPFFLRYYDEFIAETTKDLTMGHEEQIKQHIKSLSDPATRLIYLVIIRKIKKLLGL